MTDDEGKADTLSSQALHLLLSNQVSESFNCPAPTKNTGSSTVEGHQNEIITVNYTLLCSCSTIGYQESTSTLITARSFAKSNHTTKAWDILRSYFAVQGANGFLPKYRFAANIPPSSSCEMSFDNIGYEKNYHLKEHKLKPARKNIERIFPSLGNSDRRLIPSPEIFGKALPPYQPCYYDGQFIPSPRENSNNFITSSPTCADSNGQFTYVQELNIHGSGRLSSEPYHATMILQLYYQSEQTIEDFQHLQFYFQRLYKWHSYLHQVVMRGCDNHYDEKNMAKGFNITNDTRILQENPIQNACYNIIHPSETSTDISSPLWKIVLKPIMKLMRETEWTAQRDTHVSHSSDDEITTFDAIMYLSECHSNVTQRFMVEHNNTQQFNTEQYERALITHCPFAMLNTANLAALSRSNTDLLQIAKILTDMNGKIIPTKAQLETIENWSTSTRSLLQSMHVPEFGYPSQMLHFVEDDHNDKIPSTQSTSFDHNNRGNDFTSKSMLDNSEMVASMKNFQYNHSDAILEPNAYYLLAGWDELSKESFEENIVSPLLERDGTFSFDCGSKTIWSWGNCSNGGQDISQPLINPLLNYLLSSGLLRNGANGIGSFIRNSTLQLICRDDTESHEIIRNKTFDASCLEKFKDGKIEWSQFYAADDHIIDRYITSDRKGRNRFDQFDFPPLLVASDKNYQTMQDLCETSWSSTAAIAYDILQPDKPFSYHRAPPIQHQWVLLIIAAELIIAFSVGVFFLVLSFNLLGRLKVDDEEDAFIQMLEQQQDLLDLSDIAEEDSEEEELCDGEGGRNYSSTIADEISDGGSDEQMVASGLQQSENNSENFANTIENERYPTLSRLFGFS